MAMIPDLSVVFNTIKDYRYSITVGIALLFFAPFFFPVGWTAASATWRYAVGLLFFLSVGMILARDLWPWVSRKLGISTGKIDDEKYAKVVIRKCKEQGGDPPYRLDLEEDFDDDEIDLTLLLDFLRAATDQEIRLQGTEIVVTKEALQTLKSYL